MAKNKVKVALKDAQQFAKRFWNSAIAKMTGKPKSTGVSADAAAPANAPVASKAVTFGDYVISDEVNDRAQQGSQSPLQQDASNIYDVVGNYSASPATLRSNDAPQTPPNPPPQSSASPPVSPSPIDPQAAAFNQLSKQVEDDFYKLARMLPEIMAQGWKERLASARNKSRQNPPDYAAATLELQSIQQDLSQQRGPLEKAAYDEATNRLLSKFVKEAGPLLGDKADPLGKAFLKTDDDVEAGKLTCANAIPVVVKLDRDLTAMVEKRRLAIMGVIADYERIIPIVNRAESALPPPNSNASNGGQSKVTEALGNLDKCCQRAPIIKQFFPASSPLSGPPPAPPKLTSVKDAVAQGFQGGFQSSDLDAIKQHLAELESLAVEALKNMDVQAQLQQQSASLPVPVSDLQLTNKELGSGNFATTFVVNGPNVKPMAAKVLKSKDPNALQELDKEAEVYARLGDHPNIAKCYGKQTLPDGQTALVMEMVEGESAQKMFNNLANDYNSGKINREEYIGTMQHMIHGVLMGLAQFDALGLAHRDIKGDNIRFDPVTNEPKILDMGLVQNQGQAEPGKIPFAWAAPEQHGGTIGPQTDMFGVGQTIHQQLERNPQRGPNRDPDAPWKVRSQTGEVNEGNFFVPGVGTRPSANIKDFGQGIGNLRAGQGQSTVMPLTKASDKKTGGEVRGATAPAAEGGKFGVETAYVDFMNKLMHPDPKQRITPSEALRHPFMTDRLLDKDQVAKVLVPDKPPAAEPQVPTPNQPPSIDNPQENNPLRNVASGEQKPEDKQYDYVVASEAQSAYGKTP